MTASSSTLPTLPTVPALPVSDSADAVAPNLLLMACMIGSHAYGLAHADSDVDVRAVHLAPADVVLGLHPPQGVIDRRHRRTTLEDFTSFELGKFVHQGLKANPNVLEWWFAGTGLGPTWVHPTLAPLLEARDRLISQRARTTYIGFATSQIRKIEAAQEQGEATGRWHPRHVAKHLMHCHRILQAGEALVRTGTLTVAVPDPAALRELAERPLQESLRTFAAAIDRIDSCPSPLPEHPDVDLFDQLVRDARRRHLNDPAF